MAIIEIWSDDENGSIACGLKRDCDEMRARGDIEPTAKLLHTYDASTWLEALTRRNELLGWDPYRPMLGADGQPDASYLEPLRD